MGHQPLERLLPHASNSIYKLVLLAAKRATEIADGMPRLIEYPSSNKATSIALEEIANGKVKLKNGHVVAEKKSKDKKKE
jgi:DNA-directed RNA polymerase omega subunit